MQTEVKSRGKIRERTTFSLHSTSFFFLLVSSFLFYFNQKTFLKEIIFVSPSFYLCFSPLSKEPRMNGTACVRWRELEGYLPHGASTND